MNKLDNIVIEVLDLEHGQKVKQLFERNTKCYSLMLFFHLKRGFDATKESGSDWRFYGYYDGRFDNYNQRIVEKNNLKVLTLEEATKLLDSEPEFIFHI